MSAESESCEEINISMASASTSNVLTSVYERSRKKKRIAIVPQQSNARQEKL